MYTIFDSMSNIVDMYSVGEFLVVQWWFWLPYAN